MAKRITKPAASAFFNTDPVQPEIDNNIDSPPPAETSSSVTVPTTASSATIPNTSDESSGATFSMSLPKKSKKTKLTSLQVNEDEYKEFSKIVRELGYKKSEVINQFIRDFILANRK